MTSPKHSYLDAMPDVKPPVASKSTNPKAVDNTIDPKSVEDNSANPDSSSSDPIEKSAHPPPLTLRVDPRRQFIKIFLASLGILQAVKAIGVLLRARRSTRSLRRALGVFLKALVRIERTNIKSSIFFSAYPALYRLLTHRSPLIQQSTSSDVKAHTTRTILLNTAPVLLLGPLANLLPDNIITQLNLYTVCAAGLACARVLDTRVRTRLEQWETTVDARGSSARDGNPRRKRSGYVPYYMDSGPGSTDKHFGFLDDTSHVHSVRGHISGTALVVARGLWTALSSGGGWWLFPLTQGLLLDTAVFDGDCFPASYKGVIVSRSERYLPSAANLGLPESSTLAAALPTPNNLMALLPLFTLPPSPHPSFPLASASPFTAHALESQYAPFLPIMRLAQAGHTKAMCATLHPMESSCAVNFAQSVRESMGSALALVGGYSGLMMLLRFRKLKADPRGALLKWLVSSVRGAGFVTLAISNAWAWVCIFQRLLSPETLTRSRFGIGGILAGLWIFLVPAARRLELGLYSIRLSMLTLWKIGAKKGWWTPRRRLGFAPFALALAVLVHIKRQRLAPMEGWVGKGVTWFDADYEQSRSKSEARKP